MNPHAVVTGAASGIGQAAANRLRDLGWRVSGLDRADVSGVDHVVDVRDADAVASAVRAASSGGLDAVVCCAGISGSAAGDGPIGTAGVDAFDAVLSVNLRGAFATVAAAWEALVARRGCVVLVSSVLGLTGGGGPFRSTAYVTSKGALVALTRALATQGAASGVRANCVAPGLVATPFAARAQSDDTIRAYVAARQPLAGGPLAADAVTSAIVYLCSPEAAAITGQVLSVDGGWQLEAT